MQLVKCALFSLLAGIIGTAIISVISLLGLMAASPKTGSRSYGFFGSLYFEAAELGSNRLAMNLGIADGWPLITAALLIALFVLLVTVLYRGLRNYRARLITSN